MDFSNLYFDLNLFSIIIPIIFGAFIDLKKNRIVWFYTIFSFLCTVASLMPVKSWFGLESNYFVFYIFSFGSVIFKYFIFIRFFKYYNWLRILTFFITASIVGSLLIFGYINETMTFSVISEAIFTLIISFSFISKFYKNYEGESLRNDTMLWISIAFIFYGIINIFLHVFLNQLFEYSPELGRKFWTFIVPLNETLVNLLITYSFYLSYKNSKRNYYE